MNSILVPLNDTTRLSELLTAGADELYMGFYDDEWTDATDEYCEINRMSGFGRKANGYTLDEVLAVSKEIKNYGKSLYITLNSASYGGRAYKMLLNYLDRISSSSAGVIVSTPELARDAAARGIKVVASTMCGVFNGDIVKFYKKCGADRIILPRDLSIAEIESIVMENPDMQYEVFLMRNGCQFSDSHCLGFHRPEFGSVCGAVNRASSHLIAEEDTFKKRNENELNNMLYSTCYHRAAACGLCALYRFVKLGISAYKIVGRAEWPEGIIRDIGKTKRNIEIAELCSSEEEYLEKMEMPDDAREACKLGLGCYYPEIRY